MSAQDIKISVKNLHKAFGPKQVLKGVNFQIRQGESLVIVGGSGTGKSVTLKCILGLIKPDSGQIKVDDVELVGAARARLEEARSKIGMLFQGSALFDSLPVWENIYFRLLQAKKITNKEARHRAPDLLASVGLKADVAFLYPSELSGGMQRRVGLARAIAGEPQILFFDEPTAGLDPIISSVINELIHQKVKELGATAITITHDLRSARTIADHVAMIYEGKILWAGPVQDIDHSHNPYVEQFIHGATQGPIQVEGR